MKRKLEACPIEDGRCRRCHNSKDHWYSYSKKIATCSCEPIHEKCLIEKLSDGIKNKYPFVKESEDQPNQMIFSCWKCKNSISFNKNFKYCFQCRECFQGKRLYKEVCQVFLILLEIFVFLFYLQWFIKDFMLFSSFTPFLLGSLVLISLGIRTKKLFSKMTTTFYMIEQEKQEEKFEVDESIKY